MARRAPVLFSLESIWEHTCCRNSFQSWSLRTSNFSAVRRRKEAEGAEGGGCEVERAEQTASEKQNTELRTGRRMKLRMTVSTKKGTTPVLRRYSTQLSSTLGDLLNHASEQLLK